MVYKNVITGLFIVLILMINKIKQKTSLDRTE